MDAPTCQRPKKKLHRRLIVTIAVLDVRAERLVGPVSVVGLAPAPPVVVVLPPEDSRILGRELLYTAITRAKSRVVLWGSKKSLEAAIATTLARSSGLADALWTRTSPA